MRPSYERCDDEVQTTGQALRSLAVWCGLLVCLLWWGWPR